MLSCGLAYSTNLQTVDILQELEDRLRLLAALLGDMLSKARARAESGRSWAGMFDSRAVASMNGGGGYNRTGVSPAKRPRLVDGAKQELQQCALLRPP